VGVLKPAIKLRTVVKTMGELGDHLRDLGFKVFGTNRFAERLELDRAFAKEVCQIANIPTPKTLPFSSLSEALQLIQRYKGRWVFKVDNNLAPTFVAHEPDSSDLVEHIHILMEDKGLPKQVTGTLEENIEGVECSLEGWYQEGELIKGSLNITLETRWHCQGKSDLPSVAPPQRSVL
jgi:phosphoribosylamine-glycine ligase